MKSEYKHFIISTLICAATSLLFLIFSGKMPSLVPVQWDFNGNVTNTFPKAAFILGFPAFFVFTNLLTGACLIYKGLNNAVLFYLTPAFAVVLSAFMLAMVL